MTSNKGIRSAEVVVIRNGSVVQQEEDVVVEEPLEIRVAGETLATTMRTPGEDRFLALGFLLAEGVIRNLEDVGSIYHCGRMGDARYGNTIDVVPGPGVNLDVETLARTKRVGITQSACGVCGRDNIDDLLGRIPVLSSNEATNVRIEASIILRTPELLQTKQDNFARTGGLHAACAITATGRILAHAEDIGRHNAVDKVVGKLLYARVLPRHDQSDDPGRILAVSGRASFEIVQKAAVAGFLCVASISAPSSLAIDTAQCAGLTLAAFVRDGRFTLYSHVNRLV